MVEATSVRARRYGAKRLPLSRVALYCVRNAVLGLFSQKDGMIGEHMIAGSMIARLLVAVAAVSAAVSTAAAQSGEPIRIGFGIAMTGSLAANGKSALLAQKI